MRHEEREDGHEADHRDTVLRTVLFAFASLAAWWCCGNVASADEAPPAPTDSPASAGSEGLAAMLEMLTAPEEVVVPPQLRVAREQEPAPGADASPGVMAGVVVPLVAAVEPALAPLGEVVDPVLAAVATPLAPVVQTVVPVVDQIAGPVLGPVVTPLVAAVAPVVEQASTAVAPVLELAAPVVLPAARPVVALVAPVVEQLTQAVAEPVVAVVRPSLQSAPDPELGAVDLRPATTDLRREDEGRAPIVPRVPPADDADAVAVATTEAGAERSSSRSADTGMGAHDPATVGWDGAALTSAAPAAAPSSPGAPFAPALPAPPAVVMAHGGSDTNQRTQRLVAVLAPADGAPAARPFTPSGTPADAPLARFGGRPPVTPD